jgi:hypothetical protein
LFAYFYLITRRSSFYQITNFPTKYQTSLPNTKLLYQTSLKINFFVKLIFPVTTIQRFLHRVILKITFDFKILRELIAVLLFSDEDEDAALRHELNEVLEEPVPLEPAEWDDLDDLRDVF